MDDDNIIDGFLQDEEEEKSSKNNNSQKHPHSNDKSHVPKNKDDKQTEVKLLKLRNELLMTQLNNKEKILKDYRKKCNDQKTKISELKKKVTNLMLKNNIQNNNTIKYQAKDENKKIKNKKTVLIDQIETIEYDLDKATFFQCGICMDSFHETENVKRLPCEHIFHVDCMSQWLQKKKNCPFCAQAIFY